MSYPKSGYVILHIPTGSYMKYKYHPTGLWICWDLKNANDQLKTIHGYWRTTLADDNPDVDFQTCVRAEFEIIPYRKAFGNV